MPDSMNDNSSWEPDDVYDDYCKAKRKVYALIKNAGYYNTIPDTAFIDPTYNVLTPIMAACMIPRKDWCWTCAIDLEGTINGCNVSTVDIVEWVVQCTPPPQIQEIVQDWKKHSLLEPPRASAKPPRAAPSRAEPPRARTRRARNNLNVSDYARLPKIEISRDLAEHNT
eukprot:4400638-Pleurochrysis_carterae.AAC.1